MSQIVYLGPSFHCMQSRFFFFLNDQNVPVFFNKIKAKA